MKPKKKARYSTPTPRKAKKILAEGKAHGKKLTKKQIKFFGAVISNAKKK